MDWRHQGISPGSTLSPSQITARLALLGYSKDPTIMNNFFGKNPANKLWLVGKEELRQAGFQFNLLNAPNLLAALTPKNITANICLSCQLHRLM